MKTARILLIVTDDALRTQLNQVLSHRASIVVPSSEHSVEECLKDSSYSTILMSFDYAEKYRREIVETFSPQQTSCERLCLFQDSEWQQLLPLVEAGVISRLVSIKCDIARIVEVVLHICTVQEIHYHMEQVHDAELAEQEDKEELKQQIKTLLTQNRRLQSLATTDGLTGLANRRELNDILSKEVARVIRFEEPLSIVMCDVDFFKHYNDNFGHPAGDEVLRSIATIMRTRLRASDIPARYGGEEFLLVLPMTAKHAAIRVAESLRKMIQEYQFAHEEKQPQGDLTMSMGVATFGDDGRDVETLVEAADKALYKAKQTGRNRVCFHGDESLGLPLND
ncbi:MAG: GGDEF domain-containing protein [bacterium]|nr:GGDEF domain-containing protein [bacterium]